MKSGNRWISTPLFVVLAVLHLAACSNTDTSDSAPRRIDLPAEVADAVYTGHEPAGRAIAFVRAGQLFVAEQDQGIVFALEPAHGDTPPMVLAIAVELDTEPSESTGTAGAIALKTVTLARMRIDQRVPDTEPLRTLP